jgi:8-oxo-dGTP pyrophosphatase MutT (NUDIX family)
MAKGKVEKGEKIIDAAQREVQEETGVAIDALIDEPLVTYHCYVYKGKNAIKETHWYTMTAKPNQVNLIPQTTEGITEVIWATPEKMASLRGKYYPLIEDLLL